MKIGLSQCNPTVGDIEGNTRLILGNIRDAEEKGCDLVVFPELVLTGYPPEDLLLKPAFIRDNIIALNKIAKRVGTTAAIVGFVNEKNGNRYNAAAWLENKKIKAIYHKTCLPNYGVFDEKRYFTAGASPVVVPFRGQRIGLTICEDIWMGTKPLVSLKKLNPNLVISISASPFHIDKLPSRHAVAAKTARYLRSPLVYANMTGGQDELVFDGGSFIVNERGRIAHQFPPFSEGLYVAHVPGDSSRNAQALSPIDQTHEALIIGLRDYVNKNGFKHVALGLSGGIDSALVATLAVEALGSERVTAVTMPSRHNSKETYGDAILLAKNLGIELLDIAIQPICDTFFQALASAFKGTTPNIAEENIQARVRGTLLMALSNKFGWLILTTGNKSETSTGYCTLYGDTAGGFAVLKDVLKTTVFALSRRINENAGRSIIPETTLLRRPTAELKENQFDEDSLGAYTQLDPIIVHYVEENNTLAQIRANTKADPSYLSRIISLVDRNEYKRRQAPPGIKITSRSFGRDHRMPITNRYRER